MNGFEILIYFIAIVLLPLNYLFEKFRVGILWIFYVAWIIPVLLSQAQSLPLNAPWHAITYISAMTVIFGFYSGYVSAKAIPLKIKIKTIKVSDKIYFRATYLIGIISAIAFMVLYALHREAPMLSGDIGNSRTSLIANNPILWSATQLSLMFSSGAYLIVSKKYCYEYRVRILFWILFGLIVMSGWRSYLLLYVIHYFLPKFLNKKSKLSEALKPVAVVLICFFLIGFTRGDTGGIFSFNAAIEIIGLYIYPSFLNFQELINYEYDKPTLFTFQFLLKPILAALDFELVPMQSAIEAFNVSTGMNALYADGGLTMIFIALFLLGFVMRVLDISKNNNVITQFWKITLIYTLLMMHNGWFLLNFTPMYNTAALIIIVCTLKIMTKSSRNSEVNSLTK